MGKRKGSLKETLSYALHSDDPSLFSVSYRDKDKIKKVSLQDFVTREEFSDIPLTRILQITRSGLAVWEKGQKQIKVNKSFVGL
jgi:uncharacterized protein (UPF0248 family)